MGMNVFYFLNQNFSFNLIGLTQIIIDAQHQQTPMQEKLQLYYSKQDAKMGHRSFGFDVMDQSLPRALRTRACIELVLQKSTTILSSTADLLNLANLCLPRTICLQNIFKDKLRASTWLTTCLSIILSAFLSASHG